MPLRSLLPRSRRGHLWSAAGVALCLATLLPAAADAQRSRGEPEFTRQGLLVAPFALGPGTDRELGGRVSEELRERLDDLLPNREVEMVRNDSVRAKLERAGFAPDSAASLPTLRQLSRSLRADEILVGTVARGPDGIRLTAQLVLARDVRLRQPYAPVTAHATYRFFRRPLTSRLVQTSGASLMIAVSLSLCGISPAK